MSAAARDREQPDEPLRPTREVALRPTREPAAPFVAGPRGPHVAPAPRVIGPRASQPGRRARTEESAPERVPVSAPERLLIASFDQRRAASGVVELRAHGFTVTPLRRAAAGPAGLSRELARALHRATIAATALGAIGALIGALITPSEALVPHLGWIPGPAVGAALLAGLLGAVGLAVGLLAILVTPQRSLDPILEGSQTLLAVQAEVSVDILAAAIVAAGGAVVAH